MPFGENVTDSALTEKCLHLYFEKKYAHEGADVFSAKILIALTVRE
jgi:hypothetical protein